MTDSAPSLAPSWRVLAACVVLAALWLAMWRLGGGALDARIYEALYAGHRPTLLAAARVITFLGEPTILVGAGFITAAWLWRQGHHRLPVALLLIVLVGRGLSEIQKYEIARVRPALEPHLVVVRTSSFPSGHATSSMIFYLTVALALTARGRWRWPAIGGAIGLSLAIGVSRVMLGVHWPSDVVGGWAFGLMWVLLTLRLAERLVQGYVGPDKGRR